MVSRRPAAFLLAALIGVGCAPTRRPLCTQWSVTFHSSRGQVPLRTILLLTLLLVATKVDAQRGDPHTGPPLSFVQLAAGTDFTCGITADGTALCWGRNDRGQLGTSVHLDECPSFHGAGPCAYQPQPVQGNLAFTYIEAGEDHVCGLTRDGSAYCWGSNVTGTLGAVVSSAPCGPENTRHPPPLDLLPECSRTPVQVAGAKRFVSLSVGNVLTCGVTAEGHGYCWGMDQQGTGRTIQRTPVRVAGDLRLTMMAVDFYKACALDDAGAVHCWENGISNQPVPLPAPAAFTQLSRGWGHNCALTSTGTAYCWGSNDSGQVGTGHIPQPHEQVHAPTRVAGGLRFREITAGFGRTCGITIEGALFCWGDRAGVSATPDCFHVDAYADCTPGPVRLAGLQYRSVALGTIHNCAVTSAGVGYCWGGNYNGSFGTGAASTTRDTPVRIIWRRAQSPTPRR